MFAKSTNGNVSDSRAKLWAIGVVILLMMANRMGWTNFEFARSVYELVATPIRLPLLFIRSNAVALSDSFVTQAELTKEVASLQQQLLDCNDKLDLLHETIAENNRLRELLNFKKESPSSSLVVAEVTGLDPHPLSETIIINRGSAHGISQNDPVLTPSGVAGRVIDVFKNSSRVLLLTDSQSSIGAMIQSSREIGDAMGTGTPVLKLTSIPPDAEVKEGDLVITSGMSTFYPKGLRIGTITKVKRNAQGREILITPSATMRKCEQVLVQAISPQR